MAGLAAGILLFVAGVSVITKKEKFQQWIMIYWLGKLIYCMVCREYAGAWVSAVSLTALPLTEKYDSFKFLLVLSFAFLPALAGRGYCLILVIAGIVNVIVLAKGNDHLTKAGFIGNALAWALFDFSLAIVCSIVEIVIGVYGLFKLLNSEEGGLFTLECNSGGKRNGGEDSKT